MRSHKKYIVELGGSWRVRVNTGNERLFQSFNFTKLGGRAKAFTAAVKWRNSILRKYGLTDRLRFVKSPDFFASEIKINPIIGIYESFSNNCGSHNWTARYQKRKKEYKRHFSINKMGNKKAFLEACKIRYQNTGTLIVINPEALPCKPNLPYKFA